MSGEYGTGMIRSSLTVVPRRLPVLWAKLAVFAGALCSPRWSPASSPSASARPAEQPPPGRVASPPRARCASVIGAALYLTVAG